MRKVFSPRKHESTMDFIALRKPLCLYAFVALSFFFLPTFLSSQEISQSLNSNWQFSEAGKKEWLAATVPGTIHTDLLANKKIPDPYIGTNESKVQWVETKTWEYKTTFNADVNVLKCKHKELVFDGLDTYAFVYLNDSLILTGENMFLSYRIDITKLLKKQNNILRIVFHPASELIEKNKALSSIKNLPGGDRVFIRKAQYQFGWDFGPRLVTCGIWKNVKLEGWNQFDILNVKYRTVDITNDTAIIDVEANALIDSQKSFNIELSSEKTIYYKANVLSKIRTTLIYFQIKIPHPRLWWCNGYGNPEMYDLKFSISAGNNHAENWTCYGIRKIEFYQKIDGEFPNDAGFTFSLNNHPIFIKGANWIPCDNFLPRVSSEKYFSFIQSAKKSNMNMLRVWGGGAYEDDRFYNICDSLGLMVWQDFMFACAMYPASSLHFLEMYKSEVEQQTCRLMDHPCIALWCGNNEILEGWNNWNWQKDNNIHDADSSELIRSYDGMFNDFRALPSLSFSNIPYVETSPSTGWGHPEAYKFGDVHYWGVWWGDEPFSSYDNHVGRFISEYGFQALPNLSSIQLFDHNETFSLNDSILLAHQKNEKGFEKIDKYMQRDYPVPTDFSDFKTVSDFSDYIYVSQVMQRDGIARAINDHRRAEPYCMGTMFWQFNDCWPGTTWSSNDYYGQPKLLQYALKDLYAPILVSVAERNDSVLIYIINDDTIAHDGNLSYKWMSFAGESARNKVMHTIILPSTSKMVLGFKKNDLFETLAAEKGVMSVIFYYENGKNASEFYYFTNTKSLALEKEPGITYDIAPKSNANGSYTITLRTISLAKNIYLSIDEAQTKFSDNGFDLLPKATKEVEIESPLSLEDLKKRLKIQLMNNFRE